MDPLPALEESLRQSQQIIHSILDTIPVRVFWKDRKLRFLGCNRPFAEDAGFHDPKDLVGKDDYAMGWRDQAEIYRADDRSVIESGIAKVMIEEPQNTPDGRIIWLLTSKVPLRDAKGEISGVLGTYMDITEYRNAKEAIRESEEKYRAFFATSKDVVFITSKDGRFVDFNDGAPAFFGFHDREEFGTVRVQDLYSNIREREEHIRAIEQAGFVRDYPVDLCKKDGSIIHALVTSTARKDIAGNVIGFQGTIKDITEQKRAEEALRESEQKFRDLFENSRDGMVFADIKTHKFVDSNRMFSLMLGYNPDEIKTLNITDIHPEDRLSYILGVFEKMMKHEITIVENIPVKRKDGTIFYADISAYPVNISGKGYLAEVFRDITERMKAEEALTESFAIFKTVMDSLDALVYVADMKTYEVLFVNRYGREIWGDLTGKICWESLQVDQKGPCPFCTNEKLTDVDGNPGEILIWEFQNTINGKVYECHDRAIRWTDGRIVRIEIASDITARKQAEAALRESNERYISFIKEAAMRLKTPVEVVERNINSVIKDISAGDLDRDQILLELRLQVKNMEQIRQNILDLNKTIVDGYGEISPASKQFLTE